MKVNLVYYCNTVAEGSRWRRFPATIVNGKAIPDERYPGGRFELTHYENRKRVYTPIAAVAAKIGMKLSPTDGRDAVHALRHMERSIKRVPAERKHILIKAAADYVQNCKDRNAHEAADQARLVLDEFVPLVNATYTKAIEQRHILAFHAALRKRGCADRTIANKDARLRSFLKFAGVDTKLLPPKPKYDAKLPTIYSRADIAALQERADEYMYLVIEMGMKLGLREQELMHAEWTPDIDWHHSVYRVQSKSHWNFKVKDAEERDVPIPSDLLQRLQAWRDKHPVTRLILGTASDRPNTHLLRALKRLATRATLDATHFTLHKLRRSYLTTLLRNGVDLRTVQAFAGHASLDSTLRYLRPAESSETHDKINKIVWK